MVPRAGGEEASRAGGQASGSGAGERPEKTLARWGGAEHEVLSGHGTMEGIQQA